MAHLDNFSLIENISSFAAEYIAPRPELHTSDNFPFDIWKKMGEQGILSPSMGSGVNGTAAELSVAGRALSRNGNNLGLVLSWLIHHLVQKYFIRKYGSDEQVTKFGADIAKGISTPCLAVSEPKAGAHPKHLSTTAEEKDGYYILNGEKTFLTNGTIAGIFIVIAVTGHKDGKKEFTAFIVPKDTPGLTVGEPIHLPFFKPSPHGSITLNECRIPNDNILGKVGSAYTDMILPFREIEDSLMMGPVIGSIERQIDLIADFLKSLEIEITKELSSALGAIKASVDTAALIANETAERLDNNIKAHDSVSLLIFFRKLAAEIQKDLEKLVAEFSIETSPLYDAITFDLVKSAGIAANVIKIKQAKLGAGVIG